MLVPATRGHARASSTLGATLLRNAEGRFNVQFRHDSFTGAIHVKEVHASETYDDRSAVWADDCVTHVNGISVQDMTLPEVQKITAQAGQALSLTLNRNESHSGSASPEVRQLEELPALDYLSPIAVQSGFASDLSRTAPVPGKRTTSLGILGRAISFTRPSRRAKSVMTHDGEPPYESAESSEPTDMHQLRLRYAASLASIHKTETERSDASNRLGSSSSSPRTVKRI